MRKREEGREREREKEGERGREREKERGKERGREGGRERERGRGREGERETERESYIFHFGEGVPEYVYLSQTLFDSCCLVVLGYIIHGITA